MFRFENSVILVLENKVVKLENNLILQEVAIKDIKSFMRDGEYLFLNY